MIKAYPYPALKPCQILVKHTNVRIHTNEQPCKIGMNSYHIALMYIYSICRCFVLKYITLKVMLRYGKKLCQVTRKEG